MLLPNFLMIGAAKCGSTSLYHYLAQHPGIYMCPTQDANFFALEDAPSRIHMPGRSEKLAKKWVATLDAYRALFDGVTHETAIGESSNLYLNVPRAAGRIKFHIPDAKLIAIVRNPVDRAFSNFLHLTGMGIEPFADFGDALKAEKERTEKNWHPMWYYKQTGFYYTLLQPYFGKFDRSRIKVVLYDDLVKNSIATVQDIFKFLDVDSTFRPDVSEVHKATGLPKNQSLHKFLTKRNPVKTFLKSLLPASQRANLRNNVARKLIVRNLAKPKVPAAIRGQMIEEYRDDVLKLQRLINRDLTHWLDNHAGAED